MFIGEAAAEVLMLRHRPRDRRAAQPGGFGQLGTVQHCRLGLAETARVGAPRQVPGPGRLSGRRFA